MAGFSIAAENAAVNAITASARWVSLHTADPGDNGTTAAGNEVTGGTYSREQTTWDGAANSADTGTAVTIDVPSGTTITHWGLWDAATGGTFYFGGALPASETFGSNGTYSLTPTLSASD